MTISPIRYGAVSCSDLEASLAFWRDLIGFEELWRETLAGKAVEQAWALEPGSRATISHLRYGACPNGQLRLIQFGPGSGVYSRAAEDDPWAVGIGALDCYVRDPEKTFSLLREAGFASKTDRPVYYSVRGLEQSEVVFRAPDQVNLLLVGAMNYPPELARPDWPGHFSPLVVISQFVADMDSAIRFYGEGLGLQKGLDAWVDEANRPRVNGMVGIPPQAELRLVAFGGEEGPEGKHLLLQTRGVPVRSIAHRMRPPNLGIMALGHETDDLSTAGEAIQRYGGEIVAPPTEIVLEAEGRWRTLLARAPSGILLELFERV